MEITLVDANIDDLDIINNLLRESKGYWGYEADFLDQFMKLYSVTKEYLSKGITKLVYLNNKIIGFFSFDNNNCELGNLFLHPNYIGKGFGKKIWGSVCGVAQELGCREFMIESDPNAENFYLKMGAKKIGVRMSSMGREVPIFNYIY